jgi:uncharacterized protein
MKLPFLDRAEELARLKRLFARRAPAFAVVYGRRRLGKSRLLQQALAARRAVYFVADERAGGLQRVALAREIARLVPGFDRVTYPDWDALLGRFWEAAPPGGVLAIDEFPALVAAANELPSLLQKHLDHAQRRAHLALTGSSQQMMQGLVLDRAAPLFGRADEILRLRPLPAGWIREALGLRDARRAVEAYAVWGGVPRLWELAAEHRSLGAAIESLVLSPLGVLYEEPSRLLRDDLRETSRAASILSLIGQGCHRSSEIAGRLGMPATTLSRPLDRLVELDLVRRDVPFGVAPRDAKRTSYRIADPFLRFWFRFVEPNRSALEAGRVAEVSSLMTRNLSHHVGEIWEELARASVPHLRLDGVPWTLASRWWGPGLDHRPMEIDVVAESDDRQHLLIGEARWSRERSPAECWQELERKARNLPLVRGREVHLALWLRDASRPARGPTVCSPDTVLDALR